MTETAFDRILADVPCSGTGTLAHNPEIKWRLKPEDLADLRRRQLAILRSAMQQVAPGGGWCIPHARWSGKRMRSLWKRLWLPTPSFRLLDGRLELERLRAQGELVWNDTNSLVSGQFVRTIPGVHPCDGFFVAILEKT